MFSICSIVFSIPVSISPQNSRSFFVNLCLLFAPPESCKI
nr:MAG TPA: hypothetical protein [Caudoviricetes sp.]DAO33771.1 MAG TPA: hypothetical protein [Caudoviricetes sp.]DAQ37337.1 MAG TPA: hypothetical protein [Caudoviricetes sp.]